GAAARPRRAGPGRQGGEGRGAAGRARRRWCYLRWRAGAAGCARRRWRGHRRNPGGERGGARRERRSVTMPDDISAKDVAALRKLTGAGMMDCKKALQETGGDI